MRAWISWVRFSITNPDGYGPSGSDHFQLLKGNSMNQTITIYNLIAQKHLGIDTLETRNSDRLDTHNVAVWQIRDALEAAFKAGVEVGMNVSRPSEREIAEVELHAQAAPLRELLERASEISSRLLDSEEHATDNAIPDVAEDAVVVLSQLCRELVGQTKADAARLPGVATDPELKWFAISGCLPEGDADTMHVFNVATHEEAIAAFEVAMYQDMTAEDAEATRELLRKQHGAHVFVNAIAVSDSPITAVPQLF